MISAAKSTIVSFFAKFGYCASIYNDDISSDSTSSQPYTNGIEKFELSSFKYLLSVIGLAWWVTIICIAYYGFIEICLKFNSPKYKPTSVKFEANELIDPKDDEQLEGVTILRPIKGIDSELENCLESSFLQRYPINKLQVLFCVENESDPAVPIIRNLISKYVHLDVQLLIDESYEENHFGPNPKINNLAKGYKSAKFDIIWVLDSNVYVNPGTLLRSVIALKTSYDNGRPTYDFTTGKGKQIKLVHHVPLAVSINNENSYLNLGARLDEMFLFTSHAKFYVFFNKASFAPCVNGKSNIYRRSDLDKAVMDISQGKVPIINNNAKIAKAASKYIQHPNEGIRFFSRYIGEDNMIGIALWETGRTGMTGDVVIQPIGSGGDGKYALTTNKVMDYVNRRVRWLRVRKYMVLAATLVEPTTESFVIGIFGSFGISNLFFQGQYFKLILLIHELIWCFTDYSQFEILLRYSNQDELSEGKPPYFLDANLNEKCKLIKWLPIWILREVLALPIWIMAMCGTQIDWRSRPFKIRSDLCAEES